MKSITKVSQDRWVSAQTSELKFAHATINSGDDWNRWWMERFDYYNPIKGQTFENVLEVGCGPHTNLWHILKVCNAKRIYLEDPLIQYYLTHNLNSRIRLSGLNHIQEFLANTKNIEISSSPLESLPYKDASMGLVVCINVLDHVRDYDLCMSEMLRVLNKGGCLILGQDLTNDEDFKTCPETITDIGHPVKVDMDIIQNSLNGMDTVFEKVLPRQEGRNPRCHYGTYLGILIKNSRDHED